ncbi:RGS domain-containing protein [Phascolomyces articulosus]|uniref:RGS domain-containing protein n=1 Tax=Phascolomyces articulosus TaxID=60185 RepID=A0AAD5KDL3_9FUNG|nr:RGS domain-containing protein [Phascolomyces articulosus]
MADIFILKIHVSMIATVSSTTTMNNNTAPTLESVLDNQTTDYFREFEAFLHQTFCNENLAFWIAVQQYQREYPDHGDEKQCHLIVHTHIRSNAIQEINIPCDMRQEILHQVYQDHYYHPHIFDHAVDSILELMRANSFIPFLQQKQQEQRNLEMDKAQQQQHNKENIKQRRSIGLFATSSSSTTTNNKMTMNNSSQPNVLTSSISCPSIASHHSSSASYTSSSVLHRIKRTFLLGNVAVAAAAAAAAKRRPSSMPTTPRTSGESNRRSWSPWRKRI